MSQSDDQDELWLVFRDEATEAIEELTRIGNRLSASRGGADASGDIEAVLRLLHNMKGAATVAGSEGAAIVLHSLEDTFEEAGSGRCALSDAVLRLWEGIGLVARFLGGETPIAAARRFASGEAARSEAARSEGDRAQGPTATPSAAAPAPAEGLATPRTNSSSVRVEARRLDRLMSFAGEFISIEAGHWARHEELERIQLELSQIERDARDEHGTKLRALSRALSEVVEKNRKAGNRFGYSLRSFSAAMKEARMAPLSVMVPQWRRIVAEAAHALGREARLVVEIGDVEVDRQVMEGLRDPMMHLLRNAVDHGIEPPDIREKLGKKRVGTVVVRASAPSMMVELEVSDDGRGFDIERIGRRAVERGLVAAEELARLGEEDIKSFVFAPGLSTASSVSGVSGRGVGLDVVKQRVAELGGDARIAPSKSGGSVIRIEVPATVMSTRGLCVRAGRASFVLPMAYVAHTFRVPFANVRVSGGTSAVVEEGREPLRLRWLSSLLREPKKPSPERLLVVTVSDGTNRLGLVVDSLVGEIEAVTKRLPWNIPRLPGIAGAMILGSGAVAVVLDVPRLLSIGKDERADVPNVEAPLRKRRILVVDDSLTSRTLERNILVAAGYEVDTEDDGEAAWEALRRASYDLVVTDVQMPRCDGLELTRRIRAHARLKSLPVVLVTSLEGPQDIAMGSEAGADEYIVKGRFDQKSLLEAVGRLV